MKVGIDSYCYHRFFGEVYSDQKPPDKNMTMEDFLRPAQFRIMAFAQLTYRESLRDIEACLSAQTAKLYHMGISGAISRSTLADANESRDWRIYADFAQRLIAQARQLYAGEDLGIDLSNTVYALDSTTIDLCLSMFPWAPFRDTKAAIKVHPLLDLRGAIPSFIHITDGKWHDVNILDLFVPEPRAFYIMDRAYVDFARLYALHRGGSFFITRTKSNLTVGCLVANWLRLPPGSRSRLGVITAGRIGHAVQRNRARRLLREAFRLHQNELAAPVDLVLIARASIVGKHFVDVEKDFLTTVRKAGLLK